MEADDAQAAYDRLLKEAIGMPGVKEMIETQSRCEQSRKITHEHFRPARIRRRYESRTSSPSPARIGRRRYESRTSS